MEVVILEDVPELPLQLVPVVEALEPALDRLVIVGGWAHRFFRFHPLAMQPSEDLLMTEDFDLAIPVEALATSWPPLGERLAQAGFVLKQGGGELGESRIYSYRPNPTFTIQFLAVRRGLGTSRDGTVVRTVQVGGISAEVLGDLDLFTVDPWRLTCSRPVVGTIELAIVHPTAFVVGKLLVSCAPNRGPAERAKDLVYVADTLRLFLDRLEDLRAEASGLGERIGEKRRRRLGQALRRHFLERSDDLRRAVEQTRRMTGGRPSSMEAFAGLCEDGLPRLLGEVIRWPE